MYQTPRALPQSQALVWEKRTDNFIWQYDERTSMLSIVSKVPHKVRLKDRSEEIFGGIVMKEKFCVCMVNRPSY